MPPRTLPYLLPCLRSLLSKPLFTARFSSSSSTPTTLHTRLTHLLTRLPKSTHRYTHRLLSAPKTHIISFLLLHELTAILPLLGLTFTFHYTSFLPTSFTNPSSISEGVDRFGRYFARKGWFGFHITHDSQNLQESSAEGIANEIIQDATIAIPETPEPVVEKGYVSGAAGSRILIEVATAYAITKVLLPVRVVVSVWGTPWFARVVVGRAMGIFGRGRRKDVVSRRIAAGTGATGGGVIGKVGKGS